MDKDIIPFKLQGSSERSEEWFLLTLRQEEIMSNWEFKALRFSSSGKPKLGSLSAEQMARKDDYVRALSEAGKSFISKPRFSNYFVRESISVRGSKPLFAGNIEYGYCQALHGEETAVAAYRSRYKGENYKHIVLGIVAGSRPGSIAAPCGNCRDIILDELILDELDTELEIVSGISQGGLAIVSNIQDYLFEDFCSIPIAHFAQELQHRISDFFHDGTVAENILDIAEFAQTLVYDAYSQKDIHPERKYNTVVYGRYRAYVGAHDGMCDFHPIYALRDAVRQARRNNDPFIRCVLIAAKDFGGGVPHVMYKDRQHLFELNLDAELLLDKEQDPPVYLITYKDDCITGAWKTSVKEWLPIPFSPRSFGPEFIAHHTEYLKNKQAQY
ncbi:hypothetical protein MYX07_04430 [Patescibacteria group bacterium AH-259-L07]|nr:hypothetical protein [Patescibacteria group bacterium AH-259-L07]